MEPYCKVLTQNCNTGIYGGQNPAVTLGDYNLHTSNYIFLPTLRQRGYRRKREGQRNSQTNYQTGSHSEHRRPSAAHILILEALVLLRIMGKWVSIRASGHFESTLIAEAG